MDKNQKYIRLEVKDLAVNEDQSVATFSGIASHYGSVDRHQEVVEAKSFSEFLKENDSVPLLWQHDTHAPIGVAKLKDGEKSLDITGEINLMTAQGKEAYALLKQGAIKGLSIGYKVLKDAWKSGVRYLKELELYEISVVTLPCNVKASVTAVKSHGTSYKGLEISASSSEDFNTEVELKAVKDWARNEDGTDLAKYAQAFLYVNGDTKKDCQILVAGVKDDKLIVTPESLRNAVVELIQAQLPEEGMKSVKEAIEKYYDRMGLDSPWDGVGSVKGLKDFNTALMREQTREMRWDMNDAFRTASDAILDDTEMDPAMKAIALATVFDQYKQAFISFFVGSVADTSAYKGDEPNEADTKGIDDIIAEIKAMTEIKEVKSDDEINLFAGIDVK